MGLNFPLENLFGFSNELSEGEKSTSWGTALQKLNEINQKRKHKPTILPSPNTGMILVFQINENDVSEMAKQVNAKYDYDSIARIGYLKDFQISKSA